MISSSLFRKVVLATLALVLLGACSPVSRPDPRASWSEATYGVLGELTGNPTWRKRSWIEKTARLLRNGEGLRAGDDVNRWVQMPEEQIISELMNDPRFLDTLLDFNMSFLGFRADQLRRNSDHQYADQAYEYANAVQAVKEYAHQGDYLTLFDLEGAYYMPPLIQTLPDQIPVFIDPKIPLEQSRQEAAAEYLKIYTDFVQFIDKIPQPTGAAVCQNLHSFQARFSSVLPRVYILFSSANLLLNRGGVLPDSTDEISEVAKQECAGKADAEINVDLIRSVALANIESLKTTFAEIEKFEPRVYSPKSVPEFQAFDYRVAPKKLKSWVVFGPEQNLAISNTNTNMNRKRGSYILRHFLCDDLNPVGFEDPIEHTGGPHGSDTSCYACHYKLDPMAGFFRDFGFNFNDFSNRPDIMFDDGLIKPRAEYDANWENPAGSPRQWKVGYIRSSNPKWDDKNSYGENLSDLSQILRSAPEAKRCLMKKLFEYSVGPGQLIDDGYLTYLTSEFTREAAQNSSVAMKNAFHRVFLSETYAQTNANPKTCYDHSPTEAPVMNAPPCNVSANLKTNCTTCHDAGNSTGLELDSWILAPDGKTRTFPHFDGAGKQMDPAETFSRLADRLTTTDMTKRMPKSKPMSSQDRQELYLWLQERLNDLKGAN